MFGKRFALSKCKLLLQDWTRLNQSRTLFSQGNNWMRWIDCSLRSYISPGSRTSEVCSANGMPEWYPVEWSICGRGLTSGYRPKGEHTRKHWGRCRSMAPKHDRWEQICEKFRCLNTFVIVVLLKYGGTIRWGTRPLNVRFRVLGSSGVLPEFRRHEFHLSLFCVSKTLPEAS